MWLAGTNLREAEWDGGNFPQLTTGPLVRGEVGISCSGASTLGLGSGWQEKGKTGHRIEVQSA